MIFTAIPVSQDRRQCPATERLCVAYMGCEDAMQAHRVHAFMSALMGSSPHGGLPS